MSLFMRCLFFGKGLLYPYYKVFKEQRNLSETQVIR